MVWEPIRSTPNPQKHRLQEQEEQAQMQWAQEFNAVLTTRGEDLCAIGYEGFLRSGSKGAVAVRFN
jgi:hypothetical protein